MRTDTASKGNYAPILFAMSDTAFGDHSFRELRRIGGEMEASSGTITYVTG
jgi:hypothetical protein